MNIQGIQIAQGLLTRAGEGKVKQATGNASAESKLPTGEISSPEAKENKMLPENSNLSNNQGQAFEIVYPPFFPVGSTQGIYTAMLEVEPKQEPSPEAVKAAKTEEKKTDTNAKAESQPVVREKDIRMEASPLNEKTSSNPGSVLDLKV